MDTYRGIFGDRDSVTDSDDWPEVAFAAAEPEDEEEYREPPPSPVGQDERRMQVRAYNHWAGLLDGRSFPSIEDLDPIAIPDFGPFSVVLDFTSGIENPAIQFLGEKLAEECGTDTEIATLADVPPRSLLSRITDHYLQIIANQAPIGFEAEFVNQRGHTILYRGILLPFSSDNDTIDFIYGVINWKELADQQTTDALMAEIDEALERAPMLSRPSAEPLADWADGPTSAEADAFALDGFAADDFSADDFSAEDADDDEAIAVGSGPIAQFEDGTAVETHEDGEDDGDIAPFDLSGFIAPELDADDDMALPVVDDVFDLAATPFALADDVFELDESAELDLETEAAPESMELADWLASARDLAAAARGSEDRTRHALYAAIGRAYDFAIAAEQAPGDFTELVEDAGLTVQDRAPMTPVVKLVFGADYDKTRLTEYASALCHAKRVGLGQGELAGFLGQAAGGLKGVVAEERRLKRGESGKPEAPRDAPRESLAKKLRKMSHVPLASVSSAGSEFALLVARRMPDGEVVLLGEVSDDVTLLEKAARKLM